MNQSTLTRGMTGVFDGGILNGENVVLDDFASGIYFVCAVKVSSD